MLNSWLFGCKFWHESQSASTLGVAKQIKTLAMLCGCASSSRHSLLDSSMLRQFGVVTLLALFFTSCKLTASNRIK